MRVAVVTLFPEMFAALTESGITRRAIAQQLLELALVNPREFAVNKHASVDDKPYGGGPGMVMSVAPLRAALQAAAKLLQPAQASPVAAPQVGVRPTVVYLSPQGQPLNQQLVAQLAGEQALVLLCGRYEGIDERVIEHDVDMEVSIGDYVISGGELAAMVLLDAMIRLQPGALGDGDSAGQDSFSGRGWLDYPHYTRPESVAGQDVPAVLLSGDHAAIATWRQRQALIKTLRARPDLLDAGGLELSEAERASIAELREELREEQREELREGLHEEQREELNKKPDE